MPKTILLVEDSTDTRTLMKILLKRYGYEVIEAADGKQAVEIAKYLTPDLILMDLSMPVMDGFAATEAIRTYHRCGKIPIIALTAHADLYHDGAIEAGCDELLYKPLDYNNLESKLKQYLQP